LPAKHFKYLVLGVDATESPSLPGVRAAEIQLCWNTFCKKTNSNVCNRPAPGSVLHKSVWAKLVFHYSPSTWTIQGHVSMRAIEFGATKLARPASTMPIWPCLCFLQHMMEYMNDITP